MSKYQLVHFSSLTPQWIIHCMGLLIISVVMGGNLVIDRRRLESNEKELLQLQTQVVQKVLDENLAALDATLRDIGEHAFDEGSQTDLDHRLSLLTMALSGVRTLTIMDAAGVIRASNRAELLGINASQRDYYRALASSTDPNLLYVSPPSKTSLGTYTIILSKRMTGKNGEFAGIVNAALDPAYFAPLLSSVLYAPDMWATLVHADGAVFMMLPQNTDVVGVNLAKPGTLFKRHLESGLQANVFSDNVYLTGEYRFLAVRTITPSNISMSSPLIIGISRDVETVFTEWRSTAILQVIFLAGVILSSSLLLHGFQRRQRANERELAQASQALVERNRFIRTVTDNIPGLVAYWNSDMRCEYANKAYLEWFGRTDEQMRGITIQELFGNALFAKNEPYIRAALHGEPQVFERTLTKADGTAGHTLARYIPDVENGKTLGFYVLVSDVTELKSTQAELEQRIQELDLLATTDALTGIANRRRFLERTREEIARCKRYGTSLIFLMMDVDHFKTVNDTYGHDSGDRLLKMLATTMKDTLRVTDMVGRLGGEEFGALLIEDTSESADAVARRLHEALRNACILTETGQEICFTVSIGLAEFEEGVDSAEELMRRADTALYHAKRTGRDRICWHEKCQTQVQPNAGS